MASIARNATLLFSLVVPDIEAGGSAMPLEIDGEPDHNSNVVAWWSRRRGLNARCCQLQTHLLRGSVEQQWHLNELRDIALQCLQMRTAWERVFRFLSTRGSAQRVQINYTPAWISLGPIRDYLVYEIAASGDNPLITPAVLPAQLSHWSAALVFESICLQYLQAALAQQQGVVLAAEGLAQLTTATALLDDLITTNLPRYFALRDGTETPLVAEHLYKDFLRPILRSQCHELQARITMALPEPTTAAILEAASRLWLASRQLDMSAQTLFAHQERLGGMARHREAMALLALSHVLSGAEETMDSSIIAHTSVCDDTVAHLFEHLAVEAYACVRVAHLLLSASAPIKARHDAALERLGTIHDIFQALPPENPASSNSRVLAVRISCGLATEAPWLAEFGRILIAQRADTRCLVATAHQLSSSLHIDRQFFLPAIQ